MSAGVVIDASAALSMLLSEAGSVAVRRLLSEWRRGGLTVYVPSHFWLEVANSLLRRHRLAAPLAVAVVHRLDELALETVELSRPAILLAIDLAERHGLSLYDATYLALAESVDGGLLTSDRPLLEAAGDRGVPVTGDQHRLSERRTTYGRTPAWPNYREISAFLAKLRAEARAGVGTQG